MFHLTLNLMKKTQKRKTKLQITNIIILFAIIPLFLISILVFATYKENKIEVFENESYTSTKLTSFDFDIYASSILYDNSNFDFKIKIENKEKSIVVEDLYCKVMVGSNWDGQKSSVGSRSLGDLKTTTSKLEKTVSIYNYNLTYPSKTLLFFPIKAPKLYVLLTWEEKANEQAQSYSKSSLLTYDYDDYYIKGTTKGSINNA